MATKVLMAIPRIDPIMEPALARLRAAGFEVVANPVQRMLSEDQLIELLPGVVGTIAGGEPYTERVLATAPDLKVIARMGVGYDQVDVAAATRHGTAVAMAFGTNHEEVADHAFALMAALANRIVDYHQQVVGGDWVRHVHPTLWRATVGVIGLGRIGRALARRCQGFEMRVLAYDALPDAAYASAHGIELVDLDTLFREADFVSVNAPHSADTDKIVGRERLALMKPGAYLVNTARGGLVDEGALIEALAARRIGGAGLDVFEVEPLPADSPLRELTNVVLTPHCAGGSVRATIDMTERCVDNIIAVAAGQSPGDRLLLNPEVLR